MGYRVDILACHRYQEVSNKLLPGDFPQGGVVIAAIAVFAKEIMVIVGYQDGDTSTSQVCHQRRIMRFA